MSDGEKRWTVLELLRWTTRHFSEKGIESARLDAECLLAHALGLERIGLYVEFERPVVQAERDRFRELVRLRATDRVPVSQLLGVREFWSLSLKVTSDVLTPRPETETLIARALAWLADEEGPYRVLDIGTGSGAIALAIGSERPKARIIATDISPSALQIARENAEELHFNDRVRFVEGDLFEPIEEGDFDLVVSNPPYIALADRESLPPELAHEPEQALFAGDDGLDVVRRLVAEVSDRLAPGGAFLVELAPDQTEAVAGWCTEQGFGEVEVVRDLSGQPRVVAARNAGARN